MTSYCSIQDHQSKCESGWTRTSAQMVPRSNTARNSVRARQGKARLWLPDMAVWEHEWEQTILKLIVIITHLHCQINYISHHAVWMFDTLYECWYHMMWGKLWGTSTSPQFGIFVIKKYPYFIKIWDPTF